MGVGWRWCCSVLLVMSLAGVSCGGDGTEPEPSGDAGGDTTADAGMDAMDGAGMDPVDGEGGDAVDDVSGDSEVSDGTADAADAIGGDAGDGGDTGGGSCGFPEAEIAGTSKTDDLAMSPHHCGMDSYTWMTEGPFGEVTDFGVNKSISADLLEGVAQSQGITPPKPLEHDVVIQQFSYKTQDRGSTIEASSLVAYPQGVDRAEPTDVLLFLHGTTGFNDSCAPSDQTEGQALAALFASWGYLVVAPDYIGLKGVGEPTGFLHPYLVGQATAIASLDAVRALEQMPAAKRGGLCPSNEVLAFGGSQGGHAALWVDRLAPYYARELDLLGTVATVPPADLLTQAERAMDEFVNATGNTIAFLGSASEWYGLRDRLDEVFESPYDTEVPTALEEECNPGDGVETPDTTEALFRDSLVTKARNGMLHTVDPWGCLAEYNSLTDTPVERLGPSDESYGILFVLGGDDKLVHTPIERKSYERLCEGGMPVEFLECEGAGHGETSLWAMPEILDFLEARQNGEVFEGPDTCEVPAAVTCEGTPE